MPAAFIGHGSPMNALERNRYTDAWRAFGASLPRPRAVLVVSAHWYINATAVTAMESPRTIHDFFGFPDELFAVEYPAPGAPWLAEAVAAAAQPHWVGADADSWGIDHGTWSVLCHVFPDADVPVAQLAMNAALPFEDHVDIGARLAPLRDEGVLILGSGNIVHNLRLFRFHDPAPTDWAARADEVIRAHIESGDHAALADWRVLGADVALGIPTPEHYLPLLYILALQRQGEQIHIFNDVVISAISMTSVLIG